MQPLALRLLKSKPLEEEAAAQGRKKVYFWTAVVSISYSFCFWLDTLEEGGDTHGSKYFYAAAFFHMMHGEPNGSEKHDAVLKS